MRPVALGLAAAAALTGCPSQQTFPGAESMGTFVFNAQLVASDCAQVYADAGNYPPNGSQNGFGFQATFSRSVADGGVWLTFPGVGTLLPQSWPAAFDGQYVTVTMQAARQLTCIFPDAGAAACSSTSLMVAETLKVALLSTSQATAVGNSCPAHPLDGGVPAPSGADGGILPPEDGPIGFDAVLACGEIADAVQPQPDSGCGCPACTFFESVTGVRR